MSHELGSINYTSPLNDVHTIVHGLNTTSPDVTVYEQASSEQIIPASIDSSNPNEVVITFFEPRAIYGNIGVH